MDPFRMAARCLFAYGFLLVLLRLAGKRALRQSAPFDFVLSLLLGDLVDDVVWAEVPVSQFAVAAATLMLAQLALARRKLRPSPR